MKNEGLGGAVGGCGEVCARFYQNIIGLSGGCEFSLRMSGCELSFGKRKKNRKKKKSDH